MPQSDGPLSGLRVVELTLVWAGPVCGMMLAQMGAEVIKIETGARAAQSHEDWMWSELNGGKLGIQLDLKQPAGIELLKRLLARADVFFYNMRQPAIDRLGLDPQMLLREVNPRLVIMSMSSAGTTGPEKDYGGLATTFAALGGVANLAGYPDQGPFDLIAWPDLETSNWALFALLSGLHQRNKTGKGGFIDLSQNEAHAWYTAETLIEMTMSGRVPGRAGNWPPTLLQGCYPTAGEERYISIAVGTDAEWQALCEEVGDDAFLADARFTTAAGRLAHQPAIDERLGAWTVQHENTALAERLQARGVAAIPSFSGEELCALPHLREREAFNDVVHPITGKHATLVSAPWKFSETRAALEGAGPLLGEHNEYVFGELLGIPIEERERLTSEGIIA